MPNSARTNRLAREKSPYLLQHARNPVDWFPWGVEAFEKARREDKPVLLSVGYSTCHWCHVMEGESFEDEAVALLMNGNFVPVKVDREERPDVDGVYMSYVMAVTGNGGWPMTVFLTPEAKPFYGGTYFPKEDRYGLPGFKTLLTQLAEAWKTRRDEIVHSADSAADFLKNQQAKKTGSDFTLGPDTLREAFESFASSFDPEWGGFGRAPKFPRSHALSFLLRCWARTKDDRILEVVKKTLVEMANGGMYGERLIVRPKEIYDGAVPSGNSVAALALLLLSRFTNRGRFQEQADRTLAAFAQDAAVAPAQYPYLLMALDFAMGPSSEIILVGVASDAAVKAALSEIHLRFLPNKIIMLQEPGPRASALQALAPFVGEKIAVGGKPTFYVCRRYSCQAPVNDPHQLGRILDGGKP